MEMGMNKQNNLSRCLIRFLSTAEVNLVAVWIVLAGVAAFKLPEHWKLMVPGYVFGVLAYIATERTAHRRMHEAPRSLFYASHQNHHRQRTPESGVPEYWLFAFFWSITAVFLCFNLVGLWGVWFGVATMLLLYEIVHFLCHCNYRPKTRFGWRIRVNHLKHHNYDSTQYYDMLFPRE
jgi:hypothetical protein